MPLVADRTKETSTTTGTGTLTLQGAPTGFQTFTAAFGNGVSVYYVIAGGSEYEIGIGTTGAGTLSRDTVLQSTNADALVAFSAGVKDVFCAYVADRAVTTSDAATLTNKTIDDYTNNVGANSTHFRVKAAGTIAKGSVVKATGFTPGQEAVEVALVASAADIAIGITEQALTSGQFGMAVVIGELFNVNTNAFAFNDVLYSNGAGGFTATKPSSGTYQTLGTVVRSNTNNGVIAVNIVSPQYVEVSTNTANTLALRDGSGNFAAGTITAALTGNASTATALQTARAINGVNFDGTAAITVTADAGTLTGATLASNVLASNLTSVGTLAGLTVTNPITGSVTGSSGSTTGNAATATALQTARAINGVNFDGTAAITVEDATKLPLTGGTLTGQLTGATVGNVIPFYYNNQAAFPSATTYHGAIAHSHADGKMYQAHGGAWVALANESGNVATATALQTARAINGVNFDGTAAITVTADASTLTGATLAAGVTASSLTSVGTLAGLTVTNPITGSVTGSSGSTTGNAATATALQTARNINGVSFNGTADVTVTAAAGTLSGATLASGVTASSLTSVGTLSALTTSGTTSLATSAGALSVRNVAYTFPAAQGAASTLLTNNGSGTLTWATASAPTQTIVTTAVDYNLTTADVGKQIVYTGASGSKQFFVGAAVGAAMTSGQFIDVANISGYNIGIGGGQIWDNTYTQFSSGVTAKVTRMLKYSSGKILVVSLSTNRLIRLNADGSYDSTFTPLEANSVINDITLSSDETAIYIAGNFTQITQSGTPYTRNYVAKLNGSTGVYNATWQAYTEGVQATSIAISGTTVAVCYNGGSRRINFYNTTTGVDVPNYWDGNTGTWDRYNMGYSAVVKAHPSQANVFIAFSPSGYEYRDANGDYYSYYETVFHLNTSGVIASYSQTYNLNTSVENPGAILITSTNIYWAQTSGSSAVLYRLTLGTFGSGLTSASASLGGTVNGATSVFFRATDSTYWVGCITPNAGATTSLIAFNSTLTAAVAVPPILNFSDGYTYYGVRGVALADGSLLLGNVITNIGNLFVGKTLTTAETGAQIWYPPYQNGASASGAFGSSAAQTFRAYQTMRLQKVSSLLLVTQRNTPYQ